MKPSEAYTSGKLNSAPLRQQTRDISYVPLVQRDLADCCLSLVSVCPENIQPCRPHQLGIWKADNTVHCSSLSGKLYLVVCAYTKSKLSQSRFHFYLIFQSILLSGLRGVVFICLTLKNCLYTLFFIQDILIFCKTIIFQKLSEDLNLFICLVPIIIKNVFLDFSIPLIFGHDSTFPLILQKPKFPTFGKSQYIYMHC